MTLAGFNVQSDSEIDSVIVPSGVKVGTYDVIVATAIGPSPAGTKFTVTTPAPTVSTITPATGNNSILTTVSIIGSGFFGGVGSNTVAAINVGTTPIASYSVISDTAIAGVVIPSGIAAGTYDLLVTADGGTNTSSAVKFVVTSTATTVPVTSTTPTTVTVTAAGSGYGQINVQVPANTFTGTVTLTVTPSTSIPAADRSGLTPCQVGVEITGPVGFTPQQDITLDLYYTAAEESLYTAAGFVIGYYDTVNNRWVTLHSTVYPAERRVECTLRHFTTFAILMMKAASNLQAVNIYPNPYNPNNGTFNITNLISDCAISIYTVIGITVKTINVVAGNGIATWDGTNNSGQKVASGVYYVQIKGLGMSKLLKVAVQR